MFSVFRQAGLGRVLHSGLHAGRILRAARVLGTGVNPIPGKTIFEDRKTHDSDNSTHSFTWSVGAGVVALVGSDTEDGDTIDKEDRTCDRCGVIYCDASTMRKHRAKCRRGRKRKKPEKDPHEGRNFCENCGKNFSSASNLNKHK